MHKKLLSTKLMKRNLDSLNLPGQIEQDFTSKFIIYDQMRETEQNINQFI